MTKVYLVGGGNKYDNPPQSSFVISCNKHYKNSNLIVAIDEPVIKNILFDNLEGFNTQPLFTNRKTGEYFRDNPRCFIFDYQCLYNVSSLSSGLLAICVANLLSFSEVYLLGFDKLLTDHRDKFMTIKKYKTRYYINDSKNNYTLCR